MKKIDWKSGTFVWARVGDIWRPGQVHTEFSLMYYAAWLPGHWAMEPRRYIIGIVQAAWLEGDSLVVRVAKPQGEV